MRGNRGGARVLAKLTASTKSIARAEEVARAAEGELVCMQRAGVELIRICEAEGGMFREMRMLSDRVGSCPISLSMRG